MAASSASASPADRATASWACHSKPDSPVRGDDEDGDLAARSRAAVVVAHGASRPPAAPPQPRLQQEGIERALERAVVVDQPESCGPGPGGPPAIGVVERRCWSSSGRRIQLRRCARRTSGVPTLPPAASAEISAHASSTAGCSSRMIRWVDQSRACTARLTPGDHAAARAGDRAGDRPQSVRQLLVLHRPALVADLRELAAQLVQRHLGVGPVLAANDASVIRAARSASSR